MINISHGFQYSINIKYDVDNHDKISSYIPTEKSMELFEQLLDSLHPQSTNRARIVVGAYGTGKSHLLAVFAAMLRKKVSSDTFEPVANKIIGTGNEKLANQFTEQVKNINEPYLLVFINGNNNNLQQNLTQGLVESIKEAEIDIKPNTAYLEIEKKIDQWKYDYPETYKSFKLYLKEKYQLDIDDFENMVSNCEPRAYEIFTELHPLLTSGTSFNPFHISDIAALYEDVAQKIKQRGYRGIYVVFDEFNKYLEAAVKNRELLDLKPLQDFAEMCNRSENNQVHLTLISHQHISQYANKLSYDLMNEWRKIEGRFSTFELHHHSSLIYSLISNVIIKEPEDWGEFINTHKETFKWIKDNILIKGLFKELSEAQIDEWIIKGCYPLHPCTTFCLPKLSNKVAQNERSIFTFLATNDFHSLGKYIEDNDMSKFNLLTLDYLFDYFIPSIKKLNHEDVMYKTWIKVNEAINKLQSTDNVAEKILKSLGVIIGLREEQALPPTSQIIKFALSNSEKDTEEIDNKLEQLAKNKIIYIRKSDNRIQFFSGSDEDFGTEINRIKSNHAHFSKFNISTILNDYFTPYPIIANRYNDKYEMTRYFMPKFYTVKELKKGIDWNEHLIKEGYLDGMIVLIIPETEEEIEEALNYITSATYEQILFVLPRFPLTITEDIYDYQALQLLGKDQEFISKSPLIEVELNAYLDDYYDKIEEDLSSLINPQYNESWYYYKGEQLQITSNARLSQQISHICENVFHETPNINNEMINKTNITTTISKARSKVVDRIIANDNRESIGLTGYGPDMSIFRSLIKRTGVYNYDEDKLEAFVSKDNASEKMKNVLDKIDEWLLSAIKGRMQFVNIYDILRKPPYGIRPGIIPILLAIVLKDYKETVLIKDKHGMEVPLSAETLEDIDKSPDNYSIELEDWAEVKEIYIQELNNIFEEYTSDKQEQTTNKIYPIAKGIKSWFINLPKYARESKNLSNDALSLQRALNYPSQDSKQLLFEIIPENFATNMQEINDNDKIRDFMVKINRGKHELDTFITIKIENINQKLIELFGNQSNQNCCEALKDWYSNLDANTKNHLFDDITNRFMKLIKEEPNSNYQQFINSCTQTITGLDIENWNDITYTDFLNQIQTIKNKIENFNAFTDNNNNFIKIQYLGHNNAINEISFEKTDTSMLGQTLHNTLEAQLEAYAESIPTNEKRQVLLDLILKLS